MDYVPAPSRLDNSSFHFEEVEVVR
jgi:hypothetical protein